MPGTGGISVGEDKYTALFPPISQRSHSALNKKTYEVQRRIAWFYNVVIFIGEWREIQHLRNSAGAFVSGRM